MNKKLLIFMIWVLVLAVAAYLCGCTCIVYKSDNTAGFMKRDIQVHSCDKEAPE